MSEERRKFEVETQQVRKELIACSNQMAKELKILAGSMAKLALAIEDWKRSGLGDMLKDYNARRIFQEQSVSYGKRIILYGKMLSAITIIGGTLVALVYFIANGHWPTGNR